MVSAHAGVDPSSAAGPVEPFAVPSLTHARRVARADAFADARGEGFAVGHAEGLARARAEIEAGRAAQLAAEAEHIAATRALQAEIARLAAASEALEAAAADLHARDTVAVSAVEAAVVELAVELAAATLQRELASPASVFEALRRAAPLLPDRGRPVVRVHPDVAAAVTEHVHGPQAGAPFAGAEVVGDPAVDRHGCVVDVGECRVDAQITTAVARLRANLTAGADGRTAAP